MANKINKTIIGQDEAGANIAGVRGVEGMYSNVAGLAFSAII